MGTRFTALTKYEAVHPKALAVYCSDGRFTSAVEELLRQLGHPQLDTLTFPGGPGLFNHRTCGFIECDVASRAAEFLIREHHITDVVLMAHDGCGYYGRKFPDLTTDQILTRQVEDLRLAMAELSATHPRLRLEAYRALHDQDCVTFEPIASR